MVETYYWKLLDEHECVILQWWNKVSDIHSKEPRGEAVVGGSQLLDNLIEGTTALTWHFHD